MTDTPETDVASRTGPAVGDAAGPATAPTLATDGSPGGSAGMALSASRQLISWMTEQAVSFAFTTYQVGKVFLVGVDPAQRLSLFERTFERCMALHAVDDALYLASLYQIWAFRNALGPGEDYQGHERLYLPQVSWVTGDVDTHDIALDTEGRPIFVNTLFSCIARVDERHSFVPIWRPPFISKLAAEDRCHMNGMAVADGRPRYVTAVARSDSAEGWRDWRRDGGILVDVDSGEIAVSGLSMPHAPRLHRGTLYLQNAGTGEFGTVDLASGRFQPICFCPGFLRGLAFHGDFALVGISLPRENRTFTGLPLDDALNERSAKPRCAVLVIDLRSGDIVHQLAIEGMVTELFDVAALPGVRRPAMIGTRTEEIRRTLSLPPGAATG